MLFKRLPSFQCTSVLGIVKGLKKILLSLDSVQTAVLDVYSKPVLW